MPAPARDKSEPEDAPTGGAETTLRVSEVATARYSVAERRRAPAMALVLWRPVIACVDLLSWLFEHAGGLVMLGVLGAAGYAGREVLPPYVAHYAFKDEVAEIGRAPTRDDAAVRARLLEAIARRKLAALIPDEAVDVTRNGDRRRIVVRYEVPVRLLGRTHGLVFKIDLDQWVAIPEPTILK